MQDINDLRTLIDTASKLCKSDAALARAIGAHKQNVCAWKKGTKPCPPEDVALMAALVGLDSTAWLARAIVQKHEGTAKGDQLMRALGKTLAATTVALASSGANAVAICFSGMPEKLAEWLVACSTMYRNVKLIAAQSSRRRGGFFMVAHGVADPGQPQ